MDKKHFECKPCGLQWKDLPSQARCLQCDQPVSPMSDALTPDEKLQTDGFVAALGELLTKHGGNPGVNGALIGSGVTRALLAGRSKQEVRDLVDQVIGLWDQAFPAN